LLDKQQIKLEVLFKSMSIHHRRLSMMQERAIKGVYEPNPSRQLFDPNYDKMCSVFNRLKKYAAARRKKRYLNFISTQYIMLKYKRIALKHW
jgi:hypothetical protein